MMRFALNVKIAAVVDRFMRWRSETTLLSRAAQGLKFAGIGGGSCINVMVTRRLDAI